MKHPEPVCRWWKSAWKNGGAAMRVASAWIRGGSIAMGVCLNCGARLAPEEKEKP